MFLQFIPHKCIMCIRNSHPFSVHVLSCWSQNPELLLGGCRHCSSPYSCLLKRAAHILESSDDTQIFAFLQPSVWQLKQSSPLHFSPLFTSVAHLQVSLESKISRISRQQLYTFLCHLCSFFKKYIFINFIKNKELYTKLLLLQRLWCLETQAAA